MGTIVTTAALNALKTTLNLSYMGAYNTPRPLVFNEICTTVPATKKSTLLAILDMVPEFREWVSDRVFHNPAMHSQLVLNKHYELSMGVDADDVEDNEYGSAVLNASYLGEAAAKNPDVLLGALMQGAHALLGFDGQNFFDTDHPIDVKAGTGSQSNYSASGKALTSANWEEVRGIMGTWTAGPSGRVIGARPTHLVVPTQLEGTARRILEAEYNAVASAGMENNVNRGTAKVVVFDELNSQPTAWYAIDARSVLKPFAYVKRTPAKFVMRNRPNDEGMFMQNQIQFGVDGRWGVDLGPWFRAYKAVA